MSEYSKVLKEQNDSRVRQQSSMNYQEFVTRFDKQPRCPQLKPLGIGQTELENLKDTENKIPGLFELEKQGRPHSYTVPVKRISVLERDREYSIMEAQEDDEENVQFQDDDDTIDTVSQSLTIKNKFNTNYVKNITSIQKEEQKVDNKQLNQQQQINNERNRSQSEKVGGNIFRFIDRKRQKTDHQLYEYVM